MAWDLRRVGTISQREADRECPVGFVVNLSLQAVDSNPEYVWSDSTENIEQIPK